MTNVMRACALILALAFNPAEAEQLFGAPRVDGSGNLYLPGVPGTGAGGARVTVPGGPTLGRWQSNKYISTPDTLQIKDPGSTGDISGMSVTGSGAPLQRTIESLFGDTLSRLLWTAKGDGKAASVTASITSGQKVLTVGTATFSPSDVGKRIVVGSAGAAYNGSSIVSVPVTSSGTNVTIAPAVSIVDSSAAAETPTARPDSRSATLVAALGLESTTLTTGGAGCTSGTQTFTLVGGSNWDDPRRYPAQVTGTVSGGALTGTLSIANAGSYWLPTKASHAYMPGTSGIALSGGNCTTAPTISATWNVPAIIVSGKGWLLRPASTTISLVGGTASSAPTIGTPTYAATSAPLDTTIASYQSATQATLAANAGTTLSSAPVTISWGTDDTAAVQAAINAKPNVYIPQSLAGGCYLVDTLSVPSNRTVWGSGACLMLVGASLTSMLDLGANTDIEAYGLKLQGNKETQPDLVSTSSGIRSSTGSARIKLHDLDIRDFTRHLVSLDGVTSAAVYDIAGSGTQWGAGVLISVTACSTDVQVLHNRISKTQLAQVHSYVGVTGWTVVGNTLARNAAGSGSLEGGEIADNISAYTANPCARNYTITDNSLAQSVNHGTHIGADKVNISNNQVRDYALHGIFAARAPNADPALMTGVTIMGNTMINGGFTPGTNWAAIGLRNVDGAVVTGNTADGVPYVAEAQGAGTVGTIKNTIISNNTGRNVKIAGILRSGVVDPTTVVRNNIGVTDTSAPKYQNCVESGTFSVSAAGRTSLTVPHGISGTPALKDIQLSVIRVSGVNDYTTSTPRILNADGTNLVVDVTVITPSVGASQLAKLAACASVPAP